MSRRLAWIITFAVLVLGAIMLMRSCVHGTVEDAAAPAAVPATSPSGAVNSAGTTAATAAAELARQRGQAMYEAVSALQAYLAAIGARDWAKADPYWANGTPASSGESDLRKLDKLRALRIENGNPKALDSGPIPNALEIPVDLRASIEGESLRRYRGWYRMRRAAAGGGWEITSASVDTVPR